MVQYTRFSNPPETGGNRARSYPADPPGFVVLDLHWSIREFRKIPPFELEKWAAITAGCLEVGDLRRD